MRTTAAGPCGQREFYRVAIVDNRVYVKGSAPDDLLSWRLEAYFSALIKLLCR